MSASETNLKRLHTLLEEQAKRTRESKFKFFEPYPWQKDLFEASLNAKQIMALCANQIGKSMAGAWWDSVHLTQDYPDWYVGHRFDEEVNMLVAGVSNATTRDIMQKELFGEPGDPEAFGTGLIPKEAIIKTSRLPSVPDAIFSAVIERVHGGVSRMQFGAYEQGHQKQMGKRYHWIHLDEEAPASFYNQCLMRTIKHGGFTICTMTPEDGLTRTVDSFMNNLQPGQALIQATWEDAPHLDEAAKKQLLSVFTPSEAAMRAEGIPMFGSGLCYPVQERKVSCEYMEIPRDWPRIAGIDLGWTCPTCVVWAAIDPQTDVIYIYDEYGQEKESPIYHASNILNKPNAESTPVQFPHDGNSIGDRNTKTSWKEQYEELGVLCCIETFCNTPGPGDKTGSLSVEVGISEILQRFQTGRLKIFNTCTNTLKQLKQYHRKDGKVVKNNDDYLDAMRYGALSIERFGIAPSAANQSGYYRYAGEPVPTEARGYV